MPPIRFERRRLDPDNPCEAACAADLNGDGIPDILCGEFWYPGPDFNRRCPVAPLKLIDGEYYDFFAAIPLDVNGDGFPDIITGGWWGKTLRWLENPGGDPAKPWTEHPIAEIGSIETIRAWDLDGDGIPEIVPNTPGGPQLVFKLETDSRGQPAGKFRRYEIFPGPAGHGLGCGDINGDGRPDLVLAGGWLEAPVSPWDTPWTFHPEFQLGAAGVPIIAADINGDGTTELVVGQAHGYGLHWWEQYPGNDGTRQWRRRPIDPENSQYHDLHWLDLDGDGTPELITGKRVRAHCGRDPGSSDPAGVYYFKWTGESFAKQVIAYGPLPGNGAGCGIFSAIADLDGDGKPDLIAPGKDGLDLFLNRGCG